jgi:acetylornithine deacetylase/succinyl-diaminopimelate desuccinylase-like protein
VWGRGALDMKGQVACEVAAACELGRSGWRPESGELIVIVTCDEEAGATLGAKWLCEEVPDKVRCDMIVNEGAGEAVDFDGRRYYTVVVGEKGVFRFRLETAGRAGHASMPRIGDNALMRMVEVLARLDGRQPPYDDYPEGRAALEALVGEAGDVAAALDRIRQVEPRLADQLEPTMHVTIAPTMIRASSKENVIPSRCTVQVDCRVPPGMGGDATMRRVRELLGEEDGVELEFMEEVVGNRSAMESPLMDAIRDWVSESDPGAEAVPAVLPAFTDSRWFREAFPDCVAYGFFPQRHQTLYETWPLLHSSDERIDLRDLALATRFFTDLPRRLLT